MKHFKFLHMADLHLDAPFSSLSVFRGAASERRLEQKIIFKKIIETAQAEDVDAVFISGDLFEHEYVARSSIAFINECFSSIPKIRVFISPGNHDPYVKNSYYSSFEWSPNVHIFKNEIESIYLNALNTCIYGVGFSDFLMYDTKLKGFKVDDASRINILVTHATIDTLSGQAGYHTVSSIELENSGLDYIALGHIHKFIPGLLRNKCCYPGSAAALGFDEPGQHGFVVGSVDKEGADLKFLPVDTMEYITLEVDATGVKNPQSLVSKVMEHVHTSSDKNGIIRIAVSGAVASEVLDELDLVGELLKNEFAGRKVLFEYQLQPEYDYNEIARGNDLKAVFVKELLSCISKEAEPEGKKRLEKTLYLGVCALEGRRVKRYET